MKRIIGLSGRAGSGKDTVARMIPDADRLSFAAPLKLFVQEVYAFTDEQVWGESGERNKPDTRYPREHGPFGAVSGCCVCCGWMRAQSGPVPQCFLTARHALQTLGTEWGRGCYQRTWTEMGIRRAQMMLADTVVFSDCRFLTEAKAIREAGGEVWRIFRPGAGLKGAAGLHQSETEQESPEFLELVTRTIHNIGSLDDLRKEVADA